MDSFRAESPRGAKSLLQLTGKEIKGPQAKISNFQTDAATDQLDRTSCATNTGALSRRRKIKK